MASRAESFPASVRPSRWGRLEGAVRWIALAQASVGTLGVSYLLMTLSAR